MKTTIEIPDPVFRKAKARAAERGQTLREFVTDACRHDSLSAKASIRQSQSRWADSASCGAFGKKLCAFRA